MGAPRSNFKIFADFSKTHWISLPYALLIILKQTYPSEKCVLFILCMISFKFSRFVCRFGRINSRNGAPGSTSVKGRVKRAQSLLSSNNKPINMLYQLRSYHTRGHISYNHTMAELDSWMYPLVSPLPPPWHRPVPFYIREYIFGLRAEGARKIWGFINVKSTETLYR